MLAVLAKMLANIPNRDAQDDDNGGDEDDDSDSGDAESVFHHEPHPCACLCNSSLAPPRQCQSSSLPKESHL